MEKFNVIVCQSGGPTSVINSSLYGVIKEAKKHQEIEHIYGSKNGINGIINEEFVDLDVLDEENLELLKQTPSAILGSVRHCLSNDFNHEEYQKIHSFFVKYNIRCIYYIGGNDSMDTVAKLTKFFKKENYKCSVLGIPKTIDNDLDIIDHTPGYGSAIKYIASSINEIKEDTACYKKGRVTIVEIMGRDAGWLTAASKLAVLNGNAPDLIYLPEINFDVDKFLEDVKRIYNQKHKVLVCVSEGIKDKNREYVQVSLNKSIIKDKFNHVQLGGIAAVLTTIVKDRLNLPVRGIELNLLQRCASHISSLSDINEAIKCGKFAVKQSLKNKTGKMVIMKRKNTEKYLISYCLCNINKIANKVKYFPVNWIINDNDISDEFIKYALPLMNKEYKSKWKNGMLLYTKLD